MTLECPTTSKRLQSVQQLFPTVSLFKLLNAVVFIFGVAQIFLGLSHNCTPRLIIKMITIWRVRRPDVRGDVVAEIFLQPRLGSPACVLRRRVLLPDVQSSSSHLLDPGCTISSGHDVGLHVESEAMWADEWRYNVSNTLKTPSCRLDVFHQYEYESVPRMTPLYWTFQCECQAVQHAFSKFLCNITDGPCRWERASTSAVIYHWKMSRT